MTIFKPLL